MNSFEKSKNYEDINGVGVEESASGKSHLSNNLGRRNNEEKDVNEPEQCDPRNANPETIYHSAIGFRQGAGTDSSAKVKNVDQLKSEGNLGSAQQSGLNPLLSDQASTDNNFVKSQQRLGKDSGVRTQLGSNQNLGSIGSILTQSGNKPSGERANNMNSFNIESELGQENNSQHAKGGQSQKGERAELVTSYNLSTNPSSGIISEFQSTMLSPEEIEFNDSIKGEKENLEILLKDLYTGVNPKDVLSDQELNENNLDKFFEKYLQNNTDSLAITLIGFYLALDDLENAKKNISRIRNHPDITDDNIQNAGNNRAYYIMQANLKINENDFKKARELLKKCWTIQQKYFSDGKENYLDFYATSMGRIHLKEGSLKEAEKCFNDALALRLFSKNSRLISSSYNDLALLYIEKKNEKASQYLRKACDYDRIFKEEVKANKYNVLSGQVDFKKPDLAKTEEACSKLPRSQRV